MLSLPTFLLGFGLIWNTGPIMAAGPLPEINHDVDLAHLREVLHDRQDSRGQSQAALLLVQSTDPGAEKLVRAGLHQPEQAEVFLALLAAVRLRQDTRFLDEILEALTGNHPRIRPVVAETLAALPAPGLVAKLEEVAKDAHRDPVIHQAALWTLGRTGRKQAAEALIHALSSDNADTRKVAGAALTELTGQNYGTDLKRWKSWWARHKGLSNEQWLELRLAYQTSRTTRLEGDLTRARAQVVRLHQQLYSRLPVAERSTYLRSLLEQDDPAVRALAVVWGVELLPTPDMERRKQIAQILLQLSHDGTPEVQRAAVLALGRVNEPAAFERLRELLQTAPAAVRAASARALAGFGKSTEPGRPAKLEEIIPLLQKALDDSALEVVIEAAETLGVLGAPAAGPVLTGLLRHPAESVRQTAAQALERVADFTVVDGLLKGLDDPSVTVRFSLVGALGRAAGSGQTLSDEQRRRLLARLEQLLSKDSDPGVRSRAATVLGEFAAPGLLDSLWKSAVTNGDARVQEKAWDAFVEIIARSGNASLLRQWCKTLAEAKQSSRRVQLLSVVVARWGQRPDHQAAALEAQETLIQAYLDLGRWQAAHPLVKDLLVRAEEAELPKRLGWLQAIAKQALAEGNKAEALHIVQEAQPYLARAASLAAEFEHLEKQAAKKEE